MLCQFLLIFLWLYVASLLFLLFFRLDRREHDDFIVMNYSSLILEFNRGPFVRWGEMARKEVFRRRISVLDYSADFESLVNKLTAEERPASSYQCLWLINILLGRSCSSKMWLWVLCYSVDSESLHQGHIIATLSCLIYELDHPSQLLIRSLKFKMTHD